MSVIYVLLTISIVVAVIFFIAFIHSVRSGQYEDSYTPSVRILFEDELLKTDEPADLPAKLSPRTNTKSKQI
jgi:cbb3-type cytochrome oxidase maturation protein